MKKHFSIIELIIVMLIVGTLATVSLTELQKRKSAMERKARATKKSMQPYSSQQMTLPEGYITPGKAKAVVEEEKPKAPPKFKGQPQAELLEDEENLLHKVQEKETKHKGIKL